MRESISSSVLPLRMIKVEPNASSCFFTSIIAWCNHHFDALPIEKFRHVHIPEQPHRTEQLQIELGYHISENLLKHNDNFILHGYPFLLLKHNRFFM